MARKQPKPWDRKLWGVEMSTGRSDPILIGSAWGAWEGLMESRQYYVGEPTRPLLFTARSQARQFCRERMAQMAEDYPEGHICRKWRYRPVRVREMVEVIE